MKGFIKTVEEGNKIEFLIDTQIFNQDIVLKTAFSFLDRGYFFFSLDNNKNMIVQLTKKEENSEDLSIIIGDFSDSILEMFLRDKLEQDNKIIREAIVTKAINGPLDKENFVTLDTDVGEQVGEGSEQNQIDFDKDIDEILKEIENDPELQVDEAEIEKILKEIEEESEIEKPSITANLEGLKKMKDQFKK